ncbi:hypothetical protein ACWDA7_47235 [Streptomyces sp. NPDC001156]
MRQVETPDETFTHRPGPCTDCGADLSAAPVVGVERRQVFDLPEQIRLQVAGHQLLSVRCARGKKARAAAPARVAAPVQYGPRLAAVGVGSCSVSDVQECVCVCTSMYLFVVVQRAHDAWRALSVPAGSVLPVADHVLGRGQIDAW